MVLTSVSCIAGRDVRVPLAFAHLSRNDAVGSGKMRPAKGAKTAKGKRDPVKRAGSPFGESISEPRMPHSFAPFASFAGHSTNALHGSGLNSSKCGALGQACSAGRSERADVSA